MTIAETSSGTCNPSPTQKKRARLFCLRHIASPAKICL